MLGWKNGGAFGCQGNTEGNAFHEETSMSYPDAEKTGYSSRNRCSFQAYKKLGKKNVLIIQNKIVDASVSKLRRSLDMNMSNNLIPNNMIYNLEFYGIVKLKNKRVPKLL